MLVALLACCSAVIAMFKLLPEPAETLQETAESDSQKVFSQAETPTEMNGDIDPPKFSPKMIQLAEFGVRTFPRK